MDFCRTVIHVVQPGDNFYRLAQRYQTTVPDIIMRNPGVNPYNLPVGTRLRICSGQIEDPLQKDELDLNNDMRAAWSQHGFWGTLYLVSLYYALPNAEVIRARLQKTPEDIASVFEKFYSQMMVNQLTSLLNEHVQLGGELMKALRDGEKDEAETVEKDWHDNADRIARMLSSANSDYNYEELAQMLNMHLDLMKRQMTTDLNNQYEEFVKATDENDKQLLQLADKLTEGLVKQFYQKR
ncbi:MAG: LysM peptidoglycan-binding domain-containing protein [Candidatus Gastranaerophilales bacterium]|nr:LysM peptidoglycan-binding domain-containing protein [Candidatus Gastranaerophilales bacterium]